MRVPCIAALLLAACAPTPDSSSIDTPSGAVDGKSDSFRNAPELELLDEFELEDILDHPDTARFEASGVTVYEDRIYVVFDNLRHFASFDMNLEDSLWLGDGDGYGIDDDPRVRDSDDFEGFEGITVDQNTGRFSLAIETLEDDDKDLRPVVVNWGGGPTEITWLDYELDIVNAGIEGLTHLEVDGVHWLAALCESGKCDDRSRGRLLLLGDDGETYFADLPRELEFDDYSGIAARGDRIAVTSQESSQVWIGRAFFNDDDALDFETESVFNFPRQRDGDVDFCTVEGVDWLDDDTLVAVSDLTKDGQPNRCKDHAERIHFFAIPE